MNFWPKFTPHLRRGTLLVQLLIFLCILGGVIWFYESRYRESMSLPTEQEDSLYQAFLEAHQADSSYVRDYPYAYPRKGYSRKARSSNPSRGAYGQRRGQYGSRAYATDTPGRQVASFPFDPNTADSTQLLALGLSPSQVRNIYKYRAKGGRYHRPEQFAKLYGLTVEQWEHLAPLIEIGESNRYLADVPARMPVDENVGHTAETPRDTQLFPVKWAEGQTVALNTADSTALKHIPGIGSGLARRIIRRREELGGYSSLTQLDEVDGLPAGIEKWFTLDAEHIQPLDFNHLTLNQLKRHPYINYYQARVITEHRRLYGPLQSLRDLELYPEFTPADMQRLAPYAVFK